MDKKLLRKINKVLQMPYVLHQKGYAQIYLRKDVEYPFRWTSKKGNQVYRCRYVAWLAGMLTERHQVVHHRNFNKLDDRPDNLEVLTRERHTHLHRTELMTPEIRAKMRATQLRHWDKVGRVPKEVKLAGRRIRRKIRHLALSTEQKAERNAQDRERRALYASETNAQRRYRYATVRQVNKRIRKRNLAYREAHLLEIQAQQRQAYVNLSPEQKQHRLTDVRAYVMRRTDEQKERARMLRGIRKRVWWAELTDEQRQELRAKHRAWIEALSPEQQQEKLARRRERRAERAEEINARQRDRRAAMKQRAQQQGVTSWQTAAP